MSLRLPRPPFSLKLQLTVVFGALVILASIAITWGLSEMLRERVRADAGRSLAFIASNASQVLGAGLHANASVVDTLARRESLWADGLDSAQVQRTVEMLGVTQGDAAWIGVADITGRVQTATNGMLLGVSVAERPWFQRARDGLFVGDVHPAKLLASLLPAGRRGEPLRFLDYAAPIRRGDQTLGVLGIHVNWAWAERVIDTVLPAEARAAGIEVFVFDRQGDVIYAPGGQSQALAAAGVRMPALGKAPSVVAWHDGGDFLTGAARLATQERASDLGWTIVAREPAGSAFAAVGDVTRNALLIGLLITVIGAALAGLAAHRFGADMRRMARAVRDVEAGVPDARIPSAASSAELRTLADAVGSMTHRLLTAREELERQVAQRTHELEIANAELGRQAQTDALTGLLNRRVFDPMLERMLADARRNRRALSVLMVDADHFKRINDVHGHPVGDQVLRMLADTLRTRLRASDVVARFGGEEFAVLLPETNEAEALITAQSLVDRIAAHDHPVWGKVTVSIGVATCGDGLTSAPDLLRQADEALYRAKAEGRDRVCTFNRG
jgi:diguanylate cyclase (GGDEF)-like protein